MSGHKKADSEGIVSELEYKSMKVEREYGKLYQSGMFKLAKLNGCPVPLFMFLTEECSQTNLFRTDMATINSFLGWMDRATNGENTFSVIMVRKSFKMLKDIHLIVLSAKGIYYMNPVHFWKGPNESDRINSVRHMLESGLISPHE